MSRACVSALLVITAAVAAPSTHASLRAHAACGTERWPIKTLQDPAASQVDFHPRATSIHHLVSLTPPANLGPRQRPVEFRTYKVKARLVSYKIEADEDVHLVIAD